MGFKSSKAQQGATTSIQLRFNGGLNYADAPSQIADNELARALNVVYNSQTGTLETRTGTECVTATALANPILKIYYYERSVSEAYLVCASGGKLYYLNVAAWVEIGSLTDSITVPAFTTFNAKMIVADGGQHLRTWDGTTYGSLSNGLYANAIIEIDNRLVINSTNNPDLITFSGVENETMWNTADPTNPAVGIRAGYGDNMAVNSFAVFGTDLLVSKKGKSRKTIYRVNTADASPVNWSVSLLTYNNCAQNAHTMVTAFNDVFFVDINGFKSIKGVQEYGDLQVDMIGSKINTAFTNYDCDEVSYLPAYTAIWFQIYDRTYCYHRLMDVSGNTLHAFTDLQFQQGRIRSVVQAGDTVYLAGHNGYLYKMTTTDTDEVSPDVLESYSTVFLTKRFPFFGGGILRRTSLELKAMDNASTSTAYLRANTAERDGALLKTISVLSATEYLNDATYDLNAATTLLADYSNQAWIETTTNRVRGSSIQWQIDATEGRFGVEGLIAEVALVTG